MEIIALVAGALLSLAFRSTRLYGLIGLALLLYLYPIISIPVLVLAGIGFYFYHKRRNHDLPRLSD